MAKVYKKGKQKFKISPFGDYWNKTNYYLLALGFVVLIIGFYLLSQGPWDNPVSLSIAPIVLLIAYLVIFPAAILYRKRKEQKPEQENVYRQDQG
ncbi:MAG: hypothetical protein JXA68_07450 [Ignavibacteriales bacterium]|nr:hypothetical protein [Ignavibacteriales bacterium]